MLPFCSRIIESLVFVMRLLPTLLNLPPQQTKMNPALVHQQRQLPPLLVPLIQRQLLQMLLQTPQIGLQKFGFL
ncbi:unnamed protein product [Meloidogyne enterolobii]|uniref:Uncharacterized protein n=1 Tax=Meloidogyne enterolobii TaxID=390850 RepID=A0ACB1B7J0_MELEN